MMATKKNGPAGKPLKNELIQIRVSAHQKQALKDVADREGLDLSSWLRRLAFREAGMLPLAKG
jgi:antitoxin component of RelBE/YafQ-DinJ toxin-antitoxin module